MINTERLRRAERKLRMGADGYTSMKFLREASHTFSTTNKNYFAQLVDQLDDDPLMGGELQEDDESDGEPTEVWSMFMYHVSNSVGNPYE